MPEFALVLRGYDRAQVDDYIARMEQLLAEADERVAAAEGRMDADDARASLGPRVARIIELATEEARELRRAAEEAADAALAERLAHIDEIERVRAAVLEDLRRVQETLAAAMRIAEGDAVASGSG